MNADGPEVADEGESAAGGTPDDAPSNVLRGSDNPFTFRQRVRDSWAVFRGRGIKERITSDPGESIRNARAYQENDLRLAYAVILLVVMVGQVAFADVLIWNYSIDRNFEVDPSIVIAFLSSVVVEIVGLVLVITRSIFPRGTAE